MLEDTGILCYIRCNTPKWHSRMCTDKDKNPALQMVKISITPPRKAEDLSHASHMYHLTHNLHISDSHTFGFKEMCQLKAGCVCFWLVFVGTNMLEMNRVWAGTWLASRASTDHELLGSQITGAGSTSDFLPPRPNTPTATWKVGALANWHFPGLWRQTIQEMKRGTHDCTINLIKSSTCYLSTHFTGE